MHIHESRVRARYAETDQMGVVYYANYFVWMEVARVEYCKSVGFSYQTMELEDGVLLAVVDANCRYLFPARFDQEIVIATSLAAAHPRMATFHYEMCLADGGALVACGETKHVFCGRDMKPVRLPSKYFAAFGISNQAATNHD